MPPNLSPSRRKCPIMLDLSDVKRQFHLSNEHLRRGELFSIRMEKRKLLIIQALYHEKTLIFPRPQWPLSCLI